MSKTIQYLKIITLLILNIFFIWHIFEGNLGLFAQKAYKQQIEQEEQKQKTLNNLQRKLKNEISYLQHPHNIDYLECYAIKHWMMVPKNCQIIKLDSLS